MIKLKMIWWQLNLLLSLDEIEEVEEREFTPIFKSRWYKAVRTCWLMLSEESRPLETDI